MDFYKLTVILLTSSLFFTACLLLSLQLIQLWDNLLEQRFRAPVHRYLQLRLPELILRESLRWWSLALLLGTAGLLFALKAYPLALTFAVAGSVLPPIVLRYLIREREMLLQSQLISAATGLANALKAGLSIPQGLKSVANETPLPLQTELQNVVYQFEHGRPLAETLAATRNRLQLESFTLFCLALEVASERGGKVNIAMERLSISLQDWFRLQRKLDSDTASSRFAILIMAVCPLAFFGLYWAVGMNAILLLLTTFWGQAVLAVMLMLICFGYRWACRILNIRLT